MSLLKRTILDFNAKNFLRERERERGMNAIIIYIYICNAYYTYKKLSYQLI